MIDAPWAGVVAEAAAELGAGRPAELEAPPLGVAPRLGVAPLPGRGVSSFGVALVAFGVAALLRLGVQPGV